MRHGTAAQRATRLFWGIVGSGVLVVSSVTLVWLFGSRSTPPMTILAACVMMMQQVWGLTYQPVTSPAFTGFILLGLVASATWAGGRGLWAWWRTRRLLARSALYSPGCWPTLDAALAALPHAQQRLRTLTTAHPVACTVGLWRPQIVLSTGLIAALSATELGAVLGHEWGHVHHRDPRRRALLRFCSDLVWFVPIVRVLAQDSARVMEDAADDMAVALTQQPLDLAAALVKTAQAQAQLRWSPAPALGGEHTVTARVERLLAIAPAQPLPRHYRAWAASAMVAACLLALLILPSQLVVAATSAPPLAPQLPIMACPLDTQQR